MRISDSISDVCSSDLLLNVLEYRLAEADYLGGSDYSIADMAAWPWVQASWLLDVDLASFPAVSRWSQAIAARQAVIRAARSGATAIPAGNTQDRADRKRTRLNSSH